MWIPNCDWTKFDLSVSFKCHLKKHTKKPSNNGIWVIFYLFNVTI